MAMRRIKTDHAELTEAEETLLAVLCEEPVVARAGRRLGITPKTAANRMQFIREKLGVETTDEALRIWTKRRAA